MKFWNSVAIPYLATMLISDLNYYTNVRKDQLLDLDDNEKYGIIPYDNPIPQLIYEADHLF